MDCNGNPCDGAACPGYTDAECVPDYCGDCKAVWYSNGQVVQCSGIAYYYNAFVCYNVQSILS